mgnify:CR=1 FL=1
MIFKIFFLIFFFYCNTIFAKTIIGEARVIDGDTIHINNNKIRLHGIDAPEKNQKCTLDKNEWECGKQSTIELKKIINNQIIKCETISTDKYNRYIAICYSKKLNINKIMVKTGWAIAYRYYSNDYVIDENYAIKNKLGIWNSKFEEPYLFRKKK